MGIKIPIIMINNRIAQSKTSLINGAYLRLTQKFYLCCCSKMGLMGRTKSLQIYFIKISLQEEADASINVSVALCLTELSGIGSSVYK